MDPAALAADVGAVAAIGGILALERRGAFQFMVSQPIVGVPLLGLVLGDVTTGVWLGSLLQMLWMSAVLFGANVPPNETLGSVAIGGMVLVYGRYIGPAEPAVWSVAILLGVPLGVLGRSLEIRLDRANRALAVRADEAAKAISPAGLDQLPPMALLRSLLVSAAVIFVAVGAGVAVLMVVFESMGETLSYALELVAFYVVPAVGLAVALTTVRRRRALVLAALSYLCLVVVLHPEWT